VIDTRVYSVQFFHYRHACSFSAIDTLRVFVSIELFCGDVGLFYGDLGLFNSEPGQIRESNLNADTRVVSECL